MEVTTWIEALWCKRVAIERLSEHAGRNVSERRAGPETGNCESRPSVNKGKTASGNRKRATRALPTLAGVLVSARMEEERSRNTGSPGDGVARTKPTTREGQVGSSGWRMGS